MNLVFSSVNPNEMTMSTILNGLNPSQREAVTHGKGPLLIIAGPGSGKTRTVVHSILMFVAPPYPHIRGKEHSNGPEKNAYQPRKDGGR